MRKESDIRKEMFGRCMGRRAMGVLIAEAAGLISGILQARAFIMEALGLSFCTTLTV